VLVAEVGDAGGAAERIAGGVGAEGVAAARGRAVDGGQRHAVKQGIQAWVGLRRQFQAQRTDDLISRAGAALGAAVVLQGRLA